MSTLPHRSPDFTATIRFLSAEKGGRKGPVRSGYCPNHGFGDKHGLVGAFHKYEHDGWIAPGETVEATLWLLSPDVRRALLAEGQAFTVQEGSRIVGNGVINSILNASLLSPRRNETPPCRKRAPSAV